MKSKTGIRDIIVTLKGVTVFCWEIVAVCFTVLALFIGIEVNIFNQTENNSYGSLINPQNLVKFCSDQIGYLENDDITEIPINPDSGTIDRKYAFLLAIDRTGSNKESVEIVEPYKANLRSFINKQNVVLNDSPKLDLTQLILLSIATEISKNPMVNDSYLGAGYYCHQDDGFIPFDIHRSSKDTFFWLALNGFNTSNEIISELAKPLICARREGQQTDLSTLLHDLNRKALKQFKEQLDKQNTSGDDISIIVVIVSDLIDDVNTSMDPIHEELQQLRSNNRISYLRVIKPEQSLLRPLSESQKKKSEEIEHELFRIFDGSRTECNILRDGDFSDENIDKRLVDLVLPPENLDNTIKLYYPRHFLGETKNYSSNLKFLIDSAPGGISCEFSFRCDNYIQDRQTYLKLMSKGDVNPWKLFLNGTDHYIDLTPKSEFNLGVGADIKDKRFNNYHLNIYFPDKKSKVRIPIEFVEVLNSSYAQSIIVVTWILWLSIISWISIALAAFITVFAPKPKNTKRNFLLVYSGLFIGGFMVLQFLVLVPGINAIIWRVVLSFLLGVFSIVYYFGRRAQQKT